MNDINKLTFAMCHCEPFASCHSDPVSSTGGESHYFAQGKLREAISRDCPSTSSGHADQGEPVEPFAPRNDYFSGPFTIVIPKFLTKDI